MPEIMSIVGLALDIFGVVLLFYHSPEKFPDPQWSAFFAVEGESKKFRDRWKELQPKRRRKGSAQIAVEIQHKDTFLADKGAIKHVLAAQGCPIRSD